LILKIPYWHSQTKQVLLFQTPPPRGVGSRS